MWQVLLAAAVAGSTGLVAKHLLNPNGNINLSETDANSSPEADRTRNDPRIVSDPSTPEAPATYGDNVANFEGVSETREGIFRFSSTESSGGSKSRSGSKNLTKKKKKENRKKGSKSGSPNETRVGNGCGEGGGDGEPRKRGKKFYVCLKRRKTGRNVAARCGSCLSQIFADGSSFNQGLGLGIMYMISSGKAEIGKLSTTMAETAMVVKELESELSRRRSSGIIQTLSSEKLLGASSRTTSQRHLPANKMGGENVGTNNVKVSGLLTTDDGECASSVLTEEPEPEPMEMTQLEAELEVELQRLPSVMGASCQIEQKFSEADVSCTRLSGNEALSSGLCNGVSPFELNHKLSHVLIEQQENQIMELESELHSTQSKLSQKEAELQALKDCVRRLTNFSLSDDDMDAHEGEEWMDKWDCDQSVESESNRAVVGMKRSIDKEPCGHY